LYQLAHKDPINIGVACAPALSESQWRDGSEGSRKIGAFMTTGLSKKHRISGHLGFGVTDYAASKAFLLGALEPLGVGGRWKDRMGGAASAGPAE